MTMLAKTVRHTRKPKLQAFKRDPRLADLSLYTQQLKPNKYNLFLSTNQQSKIHSKAIAEDTGKQPALIVTNCLQVYHFTKANTRIN